MATVHWVHVIPFRISFFEFRIWIYILNLNSTNYFLIITAFMYAIVDIETTGGHASTNGITEICIFIYDGEKIIDNKMTNLNIEKRRISSLPEKKSLLVSASEVLALALTFQICSYLKLRCDTRFGRAFTACIVNDRLNN